MSHIIILSVFLILSATFIYCGEFNFENLHSASATSISLITQMNDTTTSYGLSTYSGRPIQTEYISSTSSLVGKSIDTIVVDLRKAGSPSDTVQVGVFNADQSIKQLFGTISASNIATNYTQYSFSLSAPQTYQIQSGDRIGIKFTGGDASNFVAIMIDNTNKFDSTNSYFTYYTTAWKNLTGSDPYMILKGHVSTTSPTVSASPSGGTYNSTQLVTLTASAPSTIFYTTDGSMPTLSSINGPSPVSGIIINTNSTLQFFAKNSFGNTSSTMKENYVIKSASASTDPFGIKKIYADAPGGMHWYSTSFNIARKNTGNTVDTLDNWLDFSHGHGIYSISNGILSASPPVSAAPIRIYIHNPDLQSEWHNVEITAYGRNDKMNTGIPDWSWSGLMAYARTTHGANGDEDINLCDDRGYGGRLKLDGDFDFEKETAHHLSNGYAQTPAVHVWSPSDMPLNQWVGYKFVIYDKTVNGINGVQLEQWIDKNANGNWVKISSFFDNGANFGLTGSGTACKTGVNPQLQLTHSVALLNSETGKSHLSVYYRTDGQWMSYKDMSVRDILPPS